MGDAMSIRYYNGDVSDLDGATRDEVLYATYANFEYAERAVEEMVNGCNEPVTVGNLTFDPADVLQSCDPIAWHCLVSDSVMEVDTDDYPEDDEPEDDYPEDYEESVGLDMPTYTA